MAYEFGSISKRMKARKPKTKAGRGVAAGAEGFLKGVQQGLQMGMYRAMQQQKVGETENEKLASDLTVFQRSVDKKLAPDLYAEITRDILFLNTGGASITPDIRTTMLEKYKGQMTGAVVATSEKVEAPEEEYHTFELTGTKPFTYNNIRHRPGDRISVKAIEGKVSAEAGGLKGTPFQFLGPTSTVSAVTPAPPRPPTSRAPALYIKPGTNEIISVSSRGAQYVADTGESITAKELSTYTPYERKIKQYRYEKLNEKKEKIASQFVSIETIPTSEGFRYVAKTAIPTEDIIAGQDITKEWVDLSSRLKSRMEDPWDIMYKQPMGGDSDPDDDLDKKSKTTFEN